METEIQSSESFMGLIDYAIVLSLVGLGTYYFFLRKNKTTEFDTSSIKPFTME